MDEVCSVRRAKEVCAPRPNKGWYVCLRLTYLDSLLQPQRSYNARCGPCEKCDSFPRQRRGRAASLTLPRWIRCVGSAFNGARQWRASWSLTERRILATVVADLIIPMRRGDQLFAGAVAIEGARRTGPKRFEGCLDRRGWCPREGK